MHSVLLRLTMQERGTNYQKIGNCPHCIQPLFKQLQVVGPPSKQVPKIEVTTTKTSTQTGCRRKQVTTKVYVGRKFPCLLLLRVSMLTWSLCVLRCSIYTEPFADLARFRWISLLDYDTLDAYNARMLELSLHQVCVSGSNSS